MKMFYIQKKNSLLMMAFLVVAMHSNQITAVDDDHGGWKGKAGRVGELVLTGVFISVTTTILNKLVIERFFTSPLDCKRLELFEREINVREKEVAQTKQLHLIPNSEDALKMAAFWDKELERCMVTSKNCEDCDNIKKWRAQNLELMAKMQDVQIRRMEN